MNVKKEPSGRRSVQIEVEVPEHAEGSLAGHRDRAGDFVLVCAG